MQSKKYKKVILTGEQWDILHDYLKITKDFVIDAAISDVENLTQTIMKQVNSQRCNFKKNLRSKNENN